MDDRSEFEKSFEDFLYSQNYDMANDMMFLLARSAFLSGYLCAEKKERAQKSAFKVIKGNKKGEG